MCWLLRNVKLSSWKCWKKPRFTKRLGPVLQCDEPHLFCLLYIRCRNQIGLALKGLWYMLINFDPWGSTLQPDHVGHRYSEQLALAVFHNIPPPASVSITGILTSPTICVLNVVQNRIAIGFVPACEPNYWRNRMGKISFLNCVLDVELRPARTTLDLDSSTGKFASVK